MVVDYQKSKIYKLVSDLTEDKYFGSTVQSLSARKNCHKTKYDCFVKGKHHYTTAFEVTKYPDFQIILVENFPCNNVEELRARERWYIENNYCTNKNLPGRKSAEYCAQPEYRKRKNKRRREKKYFCALCNISVMYENRERHKKGNSHKF